MNGSWLVDAVKGNYCSQMQVTGPSNEEAWKKAKSFAETQGVILNLGACANQGYDHVVTTVAPKTFTKDGYVAKWDGQVWAK